MIQFTAIEEIVSRVRQSVESGDRDGELKQYTKAGGQSGRGWHVAGFYATETKESRLVFEVLHYETPSICIIRVYRENPFEILFAKKWADNLRRFELAAQMAAAVFRTALPSQPVPCKKVDDDLGDMPFSTEEREMILSVMQPIPPPCNPNTIEEA